MNIELYYYSSHSFFEDDYSPDDSGYSLDDFGLNFYIPEDIAIPGFLNTDRK